MSKRSRILSRIKTLDSVPASALQAMRLLQDPDVNMGEVVQTINYDPGLTSNILKLANSSYFGCAKAIASLRDAIVRLGASNIFKLVTAAVANVALNRKIKGYNMSSGDLWEHSIAVAVAAETLAGILKSDSSQIAFTAGLLHDMGKIVMGEFIDKKTLPKLEKLLADGMTFDKAEREIFELDHAELGALLLEEWNIPDNLVNAVRWQYEPENSEGDLAGIVHAANVICLRNDIGAPHMTLDTSVSDETFEKLGINDEISEEVILRTRDSLDTIKDVFSAKMS